MSNDTRIDTLSTLLFHFNSGFQNLNWQNDTPFKVEEVMPLTKLFPVKQELEMIILFSSRQDNIFIRPICVDKLRFLRQMVD